MKTRKQIITDMCYTQRHDYGLQQPESEHNRILESGMTQEERTALWNEMAQLFDNCIAPHMKFKIPDSRNFCGND